MAGAERSKGSKVGRLVRYFREADLDEARVVLELAERAIADRLKPQAVATRKPKRARRAAATASTDASSQAAAASAAVAQ